jgi:hypothetical protein
MKWGTKFGPEYVNRLYGMVSRHLKRPHRFICFTDDRGGLDSGIEAWPLPAMDLPPGKERGWRKLSTFQNPLADLKGQTLFLDLDVVILRDIDCFFDLPGEFLISRDWKFIRPWRTTGNSSVYRFETGAHPGAFSEFVDGIDDVKARFRNEQSYLSDWMKRAGKFQFWPEGWCISFKGVCLPPFPINIWKVPEKPKEAKIVIFHGNPMPEDAIAGRIEGLFRFLRPTPWVEACWAPVK